MIHIICKLYGQSKREVESNYTQIDFWKVMALENNDKAIENYLIKQQK